MPSRVDANLVHQQTRAIQDILAQNQDINDLLGAKVRSLLTKLKKNALEGSMTEENFKQACFNLANLLSATKALNLEQMQTATNNLMELCQFDNCVFEDQRNLAVTVHLILTALIVFTLVVTGVSFPPIAIILITILIWPTTLLAGVIGIGVGKMRAANEISTLGTDACFFVQQKANPNLQTQEMPVNTDDTQALCC